MHSNSGVGASKKLFDEINGKRIGRNWGKSDQIWAKVIRFGPS